MNIQDYYINRLANCVNGYQGKYPKVLTVCSAGLLRSATIAYILTREPYNCNTRNCGSVADYALVLIDGVLLEWADFVIYANVENQVMVENEYGKCKSNGSLIKTYCLDLPDNFGYRDAVLMGLINDRLKTTGFIDDLNRYKVVNNIKA